MEWDAVHSYFANGVRRLVDHQIDSFEDFVRNKLPLIIQSTAPITVWHEQHPDIKKYKYEFKLSFENVTYLKPRIQEATGRIKPMLPMEARVRNFTYAAQMYADVRFLARTYKGEKYESYDEEFRIFEGISLGKLPVMLGSSLCLLKDYPLSLEQYGECAHDPLGYFIVHGSERTILCQEKVADNRIMVFPARKTVSKHTYSVELKSLHESFTMPPKKLEIRLSSKFNGFGFPLMACLPRFHEDIPLMVFFRALGVEADEDIAKLVWERLDDPHCEQLGASFRECAEIGVFTQADAIRYLTHHLQYGTNQEDKGAYVQQLLNSEYLPHVRFAGENASLSILNARKALLTASMVRRLILTNAGQIQLDDRDAYPNKRVVTTGALLTHLFRQLFQKVCNDTRNEFVQEVNNDSWKKGDAPRPMDILNVNNVYKILKLSAIEGKLKQALATGNFAVQGLGTSNSTSLSNATKVGVSQVLARMSYNSTLSHLRRIQTPVEKSGKLLAPRKLHGTSWGFVCPVETPEGHSVGIVKNMSLMTSVTQHIPSNTLLHFLQDRKDITWITKACVYQGTAITLNGVILGYTNTPNSLVKDLRNAKYSMRIHPHVSIAWYTLLNTVMIETDGGRFVRPVFRAGIPLTKQATWNDWLRTCVEYIDASETETLRIATQQSELTPHHTHYEIHPTLILGHMAGSIPLSDHNQSPRNTYQSAMGKQSMCVYAGNYAKRLDKNGYLLCSLTRPIVETRSQNILKMHEMPFGMNSIVAIACYGGYNQEDSIIMNKTSVARGFMRGLYYTMYKDEEHRNVTSGREEKFMKPSKHNTRKYKNSSYHAIGEDGLPILNAYIEENDVLIGKSVNLKNDPAGYAYRDASTTHKNSEPARIDGVWQDKNSDGYPFIKVRVVSERVPQIGDKVSSRHGQKGTIGMLLDEEDMPFTASGLRPDLIMNPHAVPSRMTIAQLMENVFGKICVQRGTLGDGTPYSHLKVDELKQHMLDLGYHPYGNEIMYNGQTGEMMAAEIFIGPTFYQRLKHMVIDKKHCLTDDHDVLTSSGWKPVNRVTLEDKVATLQDSKVVYANPIKLFEYDYEGDMYEVESNQVSLKVTPNHQMWVAKSYTQKQEWRYSLREAQDILGKHVKYQKDGVWECDAYQFTLPEFGDHPAFNVDMDAWLIFFGIWIGDGWCGKTKVTIAANKPRVKSALDECLPKLNIAYRYYPTSCKLDISNRQLRNYMRPLSVGAVNKRLPDWVWKLNQEQAMTLISGLMLSDGHTVAGSGCILYSTSSTGLADDIQRLALHAGMSANKRLHTRAGSRYTIGSKTGVTTQDLWSIAFIRGKNRPAINHGHHKTQKGQREGMVPFEGKVYCMEVPGHVFYVRRNGKPVWTGNSRSKGPIVSLTRQPCEGRSRDGGLRVGEMERDCMLSHGVSVFTKERLMDVSDPFPTGICKTCGTLAIMNEDEGIYKCGTCNNQTEFINKTTPYAMKLWMQELEAMHIIARMEVK